MATGLSIISVNPIRRKFSSSKANEFHVAVKLTAPKLGATQRQPMAIIVALDISGSMAADTAIPQMSRESPYDRRYGSTNHWMSKLDVAKFALEKLVENLTDQDMFGLVTFTGNVYTPVPPMKMTAANKNLAIQRIRAQTPQNSTALAAGLYEAIRTMRSVAPTFTQRVMLFTDGEATDGDTSLVMIKNSLQALFRNELPGITTLGFGTTYNGELLGGLITNGGAHYYIDNAERIPTSFGTELGTLASIYAKDVRLEITPEKGVEIAEVLNNLQTIPMAGNRTDIMCDNLYSEQSYNVVLLVKMTRRTAKKGVPVLEVRGSLSDVTTGGKLSFSEDLSVDFVATKNADQVDDPDVASAVAMQIAAKSQREAMQAANRGDIKGAQKFLLYSADVMRSLGRADLATVNASLSNRGYASLNAYQAEGSKISSSLGATYSRQTAGMGGMQVGGVDVDSMVSNSTQRKMANAFSIVKQADPNDQMPNVDTMVTSR